MNDLYLLNFALRSFRENAELKEKLDKLTSPLLVNLLCCTLKYCCMIFAQDQNESVLDYRRRSYAQPESELSPKLKHLRRSQSMGERTTRLFFSIDDHYLRGWGLTSYHVYEVSVSMIWLHVSFQLMYPLYYVLVYPCGFTHTDCVVVRLCWGRRSGQCTSGTKISKDFTVSWAEDTHR